MFESNKNVKEINLDMIGKDYLFDESREKNFPKVTIFRKIQKFLLTGFQRSKPHKFLSL